MTCPDPFVPERIISGGQTGVDRAALDVAIELGIPHGGWCPRGRRAEDGVIPPRYQLQETDSRRYPSRTRRNVIDSDATLILTIGPPTGGTKLTAELCVAHDRAHLVVDLAAELDPATAAIRDWLASERPATLNVAGPRATSAPESHDRAVAALRAALAAG